MASINSDIRVRSRSNVRLIAGMAVAAVAAMALAFGLSFLPSVASAAEVGFKSPADTDSANQWNSANNAFTSNNVYAFADHDDDDQGYDDFGGFTIPSGSTINGVLVEIDAKQEGTACQLQTRLSWNNGSSFTAYKTLTPSSSETTLSFGGVSDTWGRSWATGDFSNTNFVVEIRYNDPTPGSTDAGCDSDGGHRDSISVDVLRAKVYYTAANTAPTANSSSVTVNEDDSVNAVVTATDTDTPAQTLTFFVVANPTHGSLTSFNSATGAFTYEPTGDYFGNDSFTFRAYDGVAYSTSATVSVTVTSVNDAPVIELHGANPVTLAVGDAYVEPGFDAWDTEEGDITGDVAVDDSAVNTSAPGTYTVYYSVEDSNGGTDEATRTVIVSDVTAPVVTVTPATQTIEATGPSGATASFSVSAVDDVDGDISGSASCTPTSGSTFAVGITTVVCSATDSSEQTGSGSATVTVVDTTAPVITLVGDASVTVAFGGSYTDAGATATDLVDGTVSVTVGGDIVDTNTPGVYTITYNAVDAHDNHAVQVTRTITVGEAPVENTQILCTDNIDNDGDELVDFADSDCAAFVPAPETPSNTNNSNTGNGGGNGGGGAVIGSGPFSIGYVNTNPTGGVVLGAATEVPASCNAYLTGYLKKGSQDTVGVKKLQSFLNKDLGLTLEVNGIFDQETFNAVVKFQQKYADEILKPWFVKGLSKDMNASGFVYKTTLHKINQLECASLNAPAPQLP